MDIVHGPVPSPVPLATAAGPPKKRKVSTDGSEPDEDTSRPSPRTAKMAKTTTTTMAAMAAVEANASNKAAAAAAAAKKPQNKYEPDVPMTKEEAAAWRREQRRKRNRESAAASRQRQRDRISELEKEVEEWKAKFSSVMERLRVLEEAKKADGSSVSSKLVVGTPTGSTDTTNVFSATPTGTRSTIPTSTAVNEGNGSSEKKQHLIETISRPA